MEIIRKYFVKKAVFINNQKKSFGFIERSIEVLHNTCLLPLSYLSWSSSLFLLEERSKQQKGKAVRISEKMLKARNFLCNLEIIKILNLAAGLQYKESK